MPVYIHIIESQSALDAFNDEIKKNKVLCWFQWDQSVFCVARKFKQILPIWKKRWRKHYKTKWNVSIRFQLTFIFRIGVYNVIGAKYGLVFEVNFAHKRHRLRIDYHQHCDTLTLKNVCLVANWICNHNCDRCNIKPRRRKWNHSAMWVALKVFYLIVPIASEQMVNADCRSYYWPNFSNILQQCVDIRYNTRRLLGPLLGYILLEQTGFSYLANGRLR